MSDLKILHGLEDIKAREGDKEQVFSCEINDGGDVRVIWYKDNREITSSDKFTITFQNRIATLSIKNISPTDAGSYHCVFEKGTTQIQSGAKLTVTKKAEEKPEPDAKKKKIKKQGTPPSDIFDSPPSFHHKLSDEVVKLGGSIVLSVTDTTMPEPAVEWFRDGVRIISDQQKYSCRHEKGLYELEILSVEAIDDAQWKAVGTNQFGTCESECHLTVIKPDENRKPEFWTPLMDITCYEKDMLKLEVTVIGVPDPKVVWYKDGQKLDYSTEYRIVDEDKRKFSLTVLSAAKKHAGTYECHAENSIGKEVSTCKVTIREGRSKQGEGEEARAPVFRMPLPASRDVPEDMEVTLVCTVTGTPAPDISWLKDEYPVNFAETYYENGVATLIIRKAKPTHSGVFTCVATNTHGVARSIGMVYVQPGEQNVHIAPKFKELLPNVSVLENSEIVLECCATGKPTPSTNWYKDGLKMIMTNRMLLYTDRKGVVRLNIMNATPDDAGEYCCEAENSQGRDYTHCTVKVIDTGLSASKRARSRSPSPRREIDGSAPIITRHLCDAKVHEGNRELLECEVQAFPEPTIEWLKDGKPITESRTLRMYFDGRIAFLKIFEAHWEHQGVYECKIENKHGSVTSKANITVESAAASEEYVPNMPRFTQKLQNIQVEAENQPITLKCIVEGTPQPEVRWLLNGKAIHLGQEISARTVEKEYFLEISKFSSKFCGTYTAVATNMYGEYHSSATVAFIENELARQESTASIKSKRPRLDDQSPIFKELLQDQTVSAGSSTILKCQVNGYPDPEIIWLKDGEILKSTRRKQLGFDENGNCTLSISNCSREDSGIYMCTAKNEHGIQSTDCALTVVSPQGEDKHHMVVDDTEEVDSEKPLFTRTPPGEFKVPEGAKVELVAKAIGKPAPAMKWLKEGRPISRSNKAYDWWVTGAGEYVLEIDTAVMRSSGVFSCLAENMEGSAMTHTELIVAKRSYNLGLLPSDAPPSFENELQDLGVANGHSAVLKCKVNGYPEPSLRWYFIDDARKSTPLLELKNIWTEYRYGEDGEVRANSVVKAQQGTYQCVATNEHGRAITSCYLLVGEMSDEPAGPARFIKCLRDIWTPLGGNVEFDVEVGGYPLPEIVWYHDEKMVYEGRNKQIAYPSPSRCVLRIFNVQISDLGRYTAEAFNVHGQLCTNAQLNVGKPLVNDAPNFSEFKQDEIIVQQTEKIEKSTKRRGAIEELEDEGGVKKVRMHLKKKGVVPTVVEEESELKSPVFEEKGEIEAEEADQSKEQSALEEIRRLIHTRNKKKCIPKFVVKPKPKKILEEFKSLRLKTAISSNPSPEVKWDKDGIILETGNKYSIYNDGDFYYLEVHQVSTYDSGFYNCTATNPDGSATCTSEVEVEPVSDTSKEKSKKRVHKEPVAPTFIQVLPEHKQANAEPNRYQMFYDGECATLKFDALSSTDTGIYTCIAENNAGTASTQTNLDVSKPVIREEDGLPPKFLNPMQRMLHLSGGEEINLRGEIIEGTEPISCTWIHNKVDIPDSSGFKYIRDGKDSLLAIKDAFPEDSGEYVCVAANKYGSARCHIELQISENLRAPVPGDKPIVKALNKIISAQPGGTTEVKFSVKATPEPVISWFFGEKQILPSMKYETLSEGNQFTLRIHNLTHEDLGTYKLMAMNSGGTSAEAVQLTFDQSKLNETQEGSSAALPPTRSKLKFKTKQ
uniref:Ig-like domain-containing protein n=1 Tax=Acrobeloides nanus TaxID=290746 RepID=A0A914CI05_9BILA